MSTGARTGARPQPHGGVLAPRWQPGQSGNPTGIAGRYQETVKLAREHSVAAMQALIDRMMTDDDGRVRVVAAEAVLKRAWGDREPPPDEDATGDVDVSGLSLAEMKLLLRVVRSLRSKAPVPDVAEHGVIEGQAERATQVG